MRYLYFACISLYLLLFSSNHAHARIRESYEDSVARYTAAGFTESRSREQLFADYENGLWHGPKRGGPGYKEVTWTYKDPQGLGKFRLISIRQLFLGQWPPLKRQPDQDWQNIMHCVEITYRFKDPLKDPKKSPEIKFWVEDLVKKSLAMWTHNAVHGITWRNIWGKMDFMIDPEVGVSKRETSKGLFHTDRKCLTIQLGENHWPFEKYTVGGPHHQSFCWITDSEIEKARKEKLAADREKQLQLMRDAVAKEIAESGL